MCHIFQCRWCHVSNYFSAVTRTYLLLFLMVINGRFTFNMFDIQAWYARDVVMGRITLSPVQDLENEYNALRAKEDSLEGDEVKFYKHKLQIWQIDKIHASIDLWPLKNAKWVQHPTCQKGHPRGWRGWELSNIRYKYGSKKNDKAHAHIPVTKIFLIRQVSDFKPSTCR